MNDLQAIAGGGFLHALYGMVSRARRLPQRAALCFLIWVALASTTAGQENADSAKAGAAKAAAVQDAAAEVDTVVVDLDQTIRVVGRRITGGETPFPFAKERLNDALAENGFSLVRKGVFLAQDVQADGFKRDDIVIIVDGERYHSACPNRMDSPLARSNSLEMEAIELNKTSSACCSGIGGLISYCRLAVADHDRLSAGVSQSTGSYEASDVGFSGTTRGHRVSGRYATGSGYADGDDKTFADRYGYREDYRYLLAEGSLTGGRGELQYRAGYTYTEDVMFPYLHMDERLNRVISGSVEYRGHKIYANYTDHVMDNGMRKSVSQMVTDATNLTIGLTGPRYEVYYRRWKADNRIVTPMVTIENALMPSVDQFAASVGYEGTHRSLLYWARAGASRTSVGEEERTSFCQPLYGDQASSRFFATLGAGVAVRRQVTSGLATVAVCDIATEAPSAQSLYIAVQKPMGKAWWSGNPGLKQPFRASLRGKLESSCVTLESSASYVWDYSDLTSVEAGGRQYKTYSNFDAIILAFNLRAEWRHLKTSIGYNWAKRAAENAPLAEIAPFHAAYTITSPPVGNGRFYWRHTYNDAQSRVALDLGETRSDSWHRFDAGMEFLWASLRFNLEVENVFDELYANHLSYLRDPFASGGRVYEPGRSVRFSVVLDALAR